MLQGASASGVIKSVGWRKSALEKYAQKMQKQSPEATAKKIKQKMENERTEKKNKKSKNMKYVKQISMEASDDTVAVALADPKKVFKQESRSEKTLSSRVRPQ